MAVRPRRDLATLRARLRRPVRPRWWQEIGLIAVLYACYSVTRDALPTQRTMAFRHAASVLRLERSLHIDVEHRVNDLVAHTHWLAYCCDYYYSTLHFIVTLAVLGWLYTRHAERYRAIRTVLLLTTLFGLIGFFVFPLAPPRMMPGYIDTVVRFHTWGSLASPAVAKASNQFAAMPSLHIGWSLWCAFAIVSQARRRWVRVAGALYPAATLFVIIGTANHYILDAAGGIAAVTLAVVIQRVLWGRSAYRRGAVTLVDLEPEPEPDLLVA